MSQSREEDREDWEEALQRAAEEEIDQLLAEGEAVLDAQFEREFEERLVGGLESLEEAGGGPSSEAPAVPGLPWGKTLSLAALFLALVGVGWWWGRSTAPDPGPVQRNFVSEGGEYYAFPSQDEDLVDWDGVFHWNLEFELGEFYTLRIWDAAVPDAAPIVIPDIEETRWDSQGIELPEHFTWSVERDDGGGPRIQRTVRRTP